MQASTLIVLPVRLDLVNVEGQPIGLDRQSLPCLGVSNILGALHGVMDIVHLPGKCCDVSIILILIGVMETVDQVGKRC
jgi:hypothetical protein